MKIRSAWVALVAFCVLAVFSAVGARSALAVGPNAIVQVPNGNSADGCRDNVLPANDDSSTGLVNLPFAINFFGNTFNSLYVNNNGNVTFDGPLSTYTPFPLLTTSTPMIAPFFGDVWTFGTSPVTYGTGMYNGRPTFCVDWVDVGYYAATDKRNDIQLLLVDRSDTGPGNFDIYFNYDKIEWEAGDASGGSGGLGGSAARAGYSNGTTASFELPGSATNGAFLDNAITGLTNTSDNSTQLGRHIFPVRNGLAQTGHTVSGHVWANTPGTSAPGAFLQLCPRNPAPCRLTNAAPDGSFLFSGLQDDTWDLTVNPPAGSGLSTGTSSGITVGGADLTGQDVTLHGPRPLPNGTSVLQTGRGSQTTGIPTVFWGNAFDVRTMGCQNGTGTARLSVAADGYSVTVPLTETPAGSGNYVATIPAVYPHHGSATITITITCPNTTAQTLDFNLYIDPSGTVVDQNNHPVAGATVTLLRSDDGTPGSFTPVPDGSAIMSPGNRSNPDTTDAVGHFGWDVLAGFYEVTATAPNCSTATSPVLTIPPPVVGLTLTLTCTNADTTPPVLTVPADITSEATGPGGAAVTYSVAGTDPDDASNTLTVSCSPNSGSTFPIGTTTVNCNGHDPAGNTAAPRTFRVTVQDTTRPSITCPAPITSEATGPNGATVTPGTATATDAVGVTSLTTYAAAVYPLGATVVPYTARDAAGNVASCSSTVTVRDTTAPTLTVPSNITVDATSPAGAVVTFTATATDLVDGSVTPSCSPSSGTTFHAGDTTVTCTATDSRHNTSASKSFTVHVRGAAELFSQLITDSTNVGPGTSLADKARSAQASWAAGKKSDACGTLNAYLNELSAQTGKKVSAAQAAALKAEVNRLRAVIGC